MQKHLYFICPTDCIEPIINNTFRNANYYYTSLGNSVVFDHDTIWQIKSLIKINNISKISFVLSNDNLIVLDAIENQNFAEISGINQCYIEILNQMKYSEVSKDAYSFQLSIFSNYLGKKIKELQSKLNNFFVEQFEISGKIYNRQENIFCDLYSDLICKEYFNLN